MSKETQPPCIPPKPEVLIVVAPGGILEVYTSRWMRVKIVRKLTGLPNTIEAELLAEEFMEQHLPAWAKELYYPGHLQKSTTIQLLTPSKELERRTALALVRECKEIAEEHNASRK